MVPEPKSETEETDLQPLVVPQPETDPETETEETDLKSLVMPKPETETEETETEETETDTADILRRRGR